MGGAVSSVFGGGDSGPSAGELIAQQQAQQIGAIGPGGRAIFGQGPGGRVLRTTLGPQAQQLADILGPAALNIAGNLADPTALQQAFVQERLDVLRPEFELEEARVRERLRQSGNPLATSGFESPGATAALDRLARQRTQLQQQLANQAVTQAANVPLQQLAQITGITPIFTPPTVAAQGVDVLGAQQIEAQQRAAQQQQQSGLLSGLVGLGSTLALTCWVAEELYGADSVRTWRIRIYLMQKHDVFTNLYRKYGRTWARWVKKYPLVRSVAKVIWDRLYRKAQNG